MSTVAGEPADAGEYTGVDPKPAQRNHLVRRIKGSQPGPCMVVMTGIHGNEGSGPKAAKRVLDRIDREGMDIAGELVVLAGNLSALQENTRFIKRDLNRNWTHDKIAAIRASGERGSRTAEDREQFELFELFGEIVSSVSSAIHFVDLHTSSADGAPFVTVGDTLRNRDFALNFPLPIMLGLEEQVDGSLLEYLNNFGFVTLGVEGGQHVAENSIDRHEAVLWTALHTAGIIPLSDAELAPYRAVLEEAGKGIPEVLEVRYRHAITDADEYKMAPGFVNFQTIKKGQLLGSDRDGDVYCPEDGRILLPLYQGKGDDGFFVCREVRPFWLTVSSMMRRLRVGGLMRFLPGVRRHPERPEVLLVNTRVARVFPLEIFHLLGFRKLRHVNKLLMVSRRRYDLSPPREILFG